ncbi:hypothetical protein SLEP1_g54327 [Rubroshorea leprosula]|uniref:Nudix hydrolase domain-containing protein n=1 Tax=Rubroshorea leprosula TaxID=152421 RepID=A0AAV5MC16_9ROSI|nr:hypothetical protein SLEP1_g54327 [Rubroshorea leprosula]
MASPSSVTSFASSPPTSPTTHTIASTSTIFSHVVFSISNNKHFVPETLTHENYLLWKELIIPILRSKSVYGHIDGSKPCPPSIDLAYEEWQQIDYQVLSWIQATISCEVLKLIITPRKSLTAKSAWDAIEVSYHSQLEACDLMLKQEFRGLQKQYELSMMDYLEHAKLLVATHTRQSWQDFQGFAHFSSNRGIPRGGSFSRPSWDAASYLCSARSSFPPLLSTPPSPLVCQWCLQANHQAHDCLSIPKLVWFSPIQPQTFMVDNSPVQHVNPNWVFDTALISSIFIFCWCARPIHRHPMITRAQDGSRKVSLLPSMVSIDVSLSEPKTFAQVVKHSEWRKAMNEEYFALLHNRTWIFVPCPPHVNVVGFKWGGIEDGEEPKSAAIRELREETGVVSAEIIAEAVDYKRPTYEVVMRTFRPYLDDGKAAKCKSTKW